MYLTSCSQVSAARLILVLLAQILIAGHANEAKPGHGFNFHWTRPSLLPTCNKVAAVLSGPQASAIRDALQAWGQRRRKSFHWEMMHRAHSIRPPTTASEKFAYETKLSKEEIEKLMQEAQLADKAAEKKFEEVLHQLHASSPDLAALKEMDIRKCVYGRTNAHGYEYRPRVSFMMQYFKRPWIIKPFIERIQACQAMLPVELLVNVDHPADHEAWAWSSYNTSGLVVPVFSNNVHEIRAYNRLAHMARGDILVLMADDDLPPKDCSWLRGVVDLLDKWPDVGVVGVRNYQHCWNIGGHYNKGDWFKDPATGIKAHWVQRVDMAPMIVRRSAYLYIGGMDETLSEPGMCGIVSDWDICHRMWTAGWSVMAASPLLMQGDGHESGTHKPQTAHKCWSLQQGTAGAVMSLRQDVSWELEMCEAARTLNLKHLVLVEQSQCPYEKLGCDLQQQASAHQQQG